MRRIIVVLSLVALAACSSSKGTDQAFFDQVSAMSKQDVFAKAKALEADKDWEEARKYYSFLSDSFPNDPLGRQAALKVADTFFEEKARDSLTEAQLRYKDFANRFPNDPQRPYALLMEGKCSFQQGRGPLRDLAPLHEAAASFQQVVDMYPDSPYTAEARELLDKCNGDLAEHEYLVARYYANVRAWVGARQRLEYLLETYPGTAAAKQGREMLPEVEKHLPGSSSLPAVKVVPRVDEKRKSR